MGATYTGAPQTPATALIMGHADYVLHLHCSSINHNNNNLQ